MLPRVTASYAFSRSTYCEVRQRYLEEQSRLSRISMNLSRVGDLIDDLASMDFDKMENDELKLLLTQLSHIVKTEADKLQNL